MYFPRKMMFSFVLQMVGHATKRHTSNLCSNILHNIFDLRSTLMKAQTTFWRVESTFLAQQRQVAAAFRTLREQSLQALMRSYYIDSIFTFQFSASGIFRPLSTLPMLEGPLTTNKAQNITSIARTSAKPRAYLPSGKTWFSVLFLQAFWPRILRAKRLVGWCGFWWATPWWR